MRLKNLLRRLRERRRDERGAVNVVLVGALVVIMTIAFAVIVPLGHGFAERRSATTAADAAALGGADYCADRLERAYQTAMRSANGWGFWAQFGKPISFYCAGAPVQAQRFASNNGAALTGFTMMPGLRFRASVRRHESVAEIGSHATSRSTAKMDMRIGACVSGGLFGIRSGGTCQTFPTMFNPKTGEPLRPLVYSPIARIDTELVVS